MTNGSATDVSASILKGIKLTQGTITNFGVIGGGVSVDPRRTTGAGIVAGDGSTIVNGSASSTKASISGLTGVIAHGASTIVNYGKIAGTATTAPIAIQFDSSSAVLVEQATGVINGQVIGGGGTLRLGGAAGYGSITGLGSTFTQFATIQVDADARWRLTDANKIEAGTTLTNLGTLIDKSTIDNQGTIVNRGVFKLANVDLVSSSKITNVGQLQKTGNTKAYSIDADLANNGTVEVMAGTLNLEGAITGSRGTLQIDDGTALRADASVGAGQTVAFAPGNGSLVLGNAPQFKATVSGFGQGDNFDFTQFGAGTTIAFTENAANTGGTLSVTNGALTAKISLLGQYMASGFHVASDSHGGSLVTYTPTSLSESLVIPKPG